MLSSILCVIPFTSSIQAEQSCEIPVVEEYSPDKEYSCNEIVQYNDKLEKFEVVNKGDVIQTRASYTNKGSVNINGQVIYAYISVDPVQEKLFQQVFLNHQKVQEQQQDIISHSMQQEQSHILLLRYILQHMEDLYIMRWVLNM